MKVALAAALAALSVLAAGVARADLLQDLGATFEQMAKELAVTFPKAETRIAALEGSPPTEVRLEGPGVAALRPGLELTAYRRGEPFRHPITSQIIGHVEEEVGVLVVSAVEGGQATARVAVTEGGRAPLVGDGARITAGRMPVAVLPTLGVQVPGETAPETALLLVSRFSAFLEKTGRFLAVEPRRVLETAAPPSGAPPPSPIEVARKLRAPAVLTSRLVHDGSTRYLEATWISGRTGGTLASKRTPLVRAVYPPRFAWEQTPELERRHALEGPVRGLALGDLDGDGRAELVVGDDRGLTVYRWQEGTGPVVFAGPESRTGGQILSLDAADVNGTGRAQVVVVEYRGAGEAVRSSVLEWTGERFRPIYETSGRYLRVIPVGAASWLVEQPAGAAEPFGGTIRRLVWQDGRYRTGVAVRVPAGVTLYGLALLPLTGSAEPEVVAITPEDRLGVWTAQGRRLWTSPDPYGGSAITFPFAAGQGTRTQIEFEGGIGRVFGRVVALPRGPEGPEILVFENLLPVGGQFRTVLPRFAPSVFTQGRMHRLRWKDGGFVRVWESRPTEGYIADFAYGDVDGDGLADVVVGTVPRGLTLDTLNPFGRPKGSLVLYELP